MKRKSAIAVFAVAFAVLTVAAQFFLRSISPLGAPVAAEGILAAIGGLRSMVSEAVWMRAGRLQREGKYVELAQLASTLTHLEPHEPEVWSYAAWNLSYNICAMMPTAEDRWRWVLAGMKLLRDDGLRLNPGSPAICRELALLFEIKFIPKVDHAFETYRAKWKQIVEDVSARDAWAERGMDRAAMAEIEEKYNVRDWTSPFASAIYWARLGLRSADAREKPMLEEILRQSVVLYAKP